MLWQVPLALVFAFVSMIEWVHFRDALQDGDILRMAATAAAAVATGFIAAELWRGDWAL